MREIIVCTTCRHSRDEPCGADGRTGGEALAQHLEACVAEQGGETRVVRQTCLWNCKRSCSVVLRDSGRFSYVTGDHPPDRAQAQAILAWFALHRESATGEVPFRQWPTAMRGRFIARIPPSLP